MSPFPQSLAMKLLRARELLMQRFRPSLYAQGLTEQQWRVLRALWEVDTMSNQSLSDRCVLHPASMSRILPKLERDGLISRRPIEQDRRNLAVTLTVAGRQLVANLIPENDRIFAGVVEDVGVEVIEAVYLALDDLNDGLSRGNERPIMTASLESRRRETRA